MKVRNSLRSLKKRDKDCRVVRRKGRVYVINKKIPDSKRVKVSVFRLDGLFKTRGIASAAFFR